MFTRAHYINTVIGKLDYHGLTSLSGTSKKIVSIALYTKGFKEGPSEQLSFTSAKS